MRRQITVDDLTPVALVQTDRERWSLVAPVGLVVTITDYELKSELVTVDVWTGEMCPC